MHSQESHAPSKRCYYPSYRYLRHIRNGGGGILNIMLFSHLFIHAFSQIRLQRYKKIFNYATPTRIFLRIVTKNLRIVTLLSPKRQIFHICVKIDTPEKIRLQ